jgi:hypothetical protein
MTRRQPWRIPIASRTRQHAPSGPHSAAGRCWSSRTRFPLSGLRFWDGARTDYDCALSVVLKMWLLLHLFIQAHWSMINGMVQMVSTITAAVGRLTFPQPALCKGLYLLCVAALYIFWRCTLHRAPEPRAATLIFASSVLHRPKSSPSSSEGEQAVADGRKSKCAFDHASCAFRGASLRALAFDRAPEPRAATLIFASSVLHRPKSSPSSSEGKQAVADGRKSKCAFDHASCAFVALDGAPSRLTCP